MCASRAVASLIAVLALVAAATADYYVQSPSPPVYIPKPTTKYAPSIPYVPKPTTKPSTTYTPQAPYLPKPATKPPTTYAPPVTPETPYAPINIAIDGVILCKSGYHTYPIKGAKVMLVCPVENSYGKPEGQVVISSNPTDDKGFFFFTPYGLTERVKNINACKVKLESSPVSTCKIPTNLNKGITGAPLSLNYKVLPDKNLKLYTVGPFFFSSPNAPKPGY